MDVVVGRVGRAHGTHGEVSVVLSTDDPARRFAVGAVLRTEPSRAGLTVRSARPHGQRLLVRFEEVDDRAGAERLRGAGLVAETSEDERPGDPDEYYDHQLVGLAVRTADGRQLGAVAGVEHLPGQEVLVVAAGSHTHRVPFVRALVPEVDLDGGSLQVEPIPGLLDVDLDPRDGAAETVDGP